MTDSARWCAVCHAYGDHHTGRHPSPATSEDLLEAMADLIERDGLAHKSYHDATTGSYCVLGAARLICSGSPFDFISTYDSVFNGAFSKLREAIDPGDITSWNDANDEATVVAKLREVARS